MEFQFLSLFNDEIFRYFLITCNGISLFVWVLTLVTHNFSQMDRLWPILPTLYSWAFLYTAVKFNLANETNYSSLARLVIMTVLITAWGARLTHTFWRRGYYKWEHEDHRWKFVIKRFNYPEKKVAFHIFNFIFMAFLQNWILIGYSLPLWYIQTNSSSKQSLNVYDIILTFASIVFFLIEAVGDQQQWNYQQNKKKWQLDHTNRNVSKYTLQETKDYERGFLVKGLFRYTRHPNYFGDICFWWCIYFFSISAQYNSAKNSFSLFSLVNYSIFSTLLMTILFQRSVKVTEKISSNKYPQYKDYQSKVGKIFPSLTAYVPKTSD